MLRGSRRLGWLAPTLVVIGCGGRAISLGDNVQGVTGGSEGNTTSTPNSVDRESAGGNAVAPESQAIADTLPSGTRTSASRTVDAAIGATDAGAPLSNGATRELTEPTPLADRAACGGIASEDITPSTVDADCDANTPDDCPAETHIYAAPDQRCAVCVEDTDENRSCGWAEACFEPFIRHVAAASGAMSCNSDDDCYAFTIDAGCGPAVRMALTGSIDEEIPWIADMYAEQNCALCEADPSRSRVSPVPEAQRAGCSDGVCVVVDP